MQTKRVKNRGRNPLKFLALTTRAGGFALALAVLVLSCGNPLKPTESQWVKEAHFPGGATIYELIDTSRTTSGLLVLTDEINGINEHALWDYTATSGYRKIFSIPSSRDSAGLNTIGHEAGESTVWLGGYRNIAPPEENPTMVPLIYRFNGDTWGEIVPPDNLTGAVAMIVPINADTCWLSIGNETTSYSGHNGHVYKYSEGTFTAYEDLGMIGGVLRSAFGRTIARDCETGYTYVIPKYALHVFVTPDDGCTWYRETVSPYVGGHRLDYILSVCPAGGNCYLLAQGELGSYAILGRTGAPGAGKYELLFYHYQGPRLGQLKELAVDDTGRVLATGYNSVVIMEKDVWQEEDLPGAADDSIRKPCAAPRGGFYGLGSEGLMYHP